MTGFLLGMQKIEGDLYYLDGVNQLFCLPDYQSGFPEERRKFFSGL